MKILVLNGANLNLLGRRKPELYGNLTLHELNCQVKQFASSLNIETEFQGSNCEGALLDILSQTDADAVVLNAGAYTHYSYALRDCIEGIGIPVAEAHLTDIFSREHFRKVDVLADVVVACFAGKGKQSYFDAVKFLHDYLLEGKNV